MNRRSTHRTGPGRSWTPRALAISRREPTAWAHRGRVKRDLPLWEVVVAPREEAAVSTSRTLPLRLGREREIMMRRVHIRFAPREAAHEVLPVPERPLLRLARARRLHVARPLRVGHRIDVDLEGPDLDLVRRHRSFEPGTLRRLAAASTCRTLERTEFPVRVEPPPSLRAGAQADPPRRAWSDRDPRARDRDQSFAVRRERSITGFALSRGLTRAAKFFRGLEFLARAFFEVLACARDVWRLPPTSRWRRTAHRSNLSSACCRRCVQARQGSSPDRATQSGFSRGAR